MRAIVFGGQGNVRPKDLTKLLKTRYASELIREIETEVPGFKQSLEDADYGRLSTVRYEIYVTYFANEVYFRRFEEKYGEPDLLVSHSAGIFNMVTAAKIITPAKMFKFLRQRADLFETYNGDHSLVMVMTDDFDSLVSKTKTADYEVAIRTSGTAGVLGINESNLAKLVGLAGSAGCRFKYRKTGIPVPYHTSYISDYRDKYTKLIKDLRKDSTCCSDSIRFLLESDDIWTEIERQLDGMIDWQLLIRKLLNDETTQIFDSTPNMFVAKQLQKNGGSVGKEIFGREIWKK